MLRPRYREQTAAEPLGILLLPRRLEEFELAPDHARDLLSIPRVVAVEPPGRSPPKFLRDSLPTRQARRLRFPGEPRVLVLYHPSQYLLARALLARHVESELWYVVRDGAELTEALGYKQDELLEMDQLARARARQTIGPEDDALRYRLRELEIISTRPFVPWGRVEGR
jgi:hypothetical protein